MDLPPFSREFRAKYTGLAPLGEGGMARVFRAHDATLDRPVAIKVLKQLDADQTARFRREARTLAALEHPNILRVYDADCDGALPYLVCELVDGRSLDAAVWGQPVDVLAAARCAVEVGAALHYAHGRGIVHRDVKPENVLLTREGVHKLADFGIARPLSAGNTVTSADMVMGTPEFIAPELVEGSAPAPSADQYALGVLLYWLVTRRFPFAGIGPHEQLRARLAGDPEPPSRHASVPAPLERVIVTMLARHPRDRYEHVEAACVAVAEATGLPGAAPRRRSGVPGRGTAAAPRASMTRGPLAAPRASKPLLVLLGAIAVVGFAAGTLWLRARPVPVVETSPGPRVMPPTPATPATPELCPITSVLRHPRFRGRGLAMAEVRELRALTGMELGNDGQIYRYWFDLADWIEGHRPRPPVFAGADKGEIDLIQEPLFIRAVNGAQRRDDLALASVAIRFTATNPDDARPWLVLGRALMLEDRPEPAQRVFAHALALPFPCGNMDWSPPVAAGYVHAVLATGAGAEERLMKRVEACAKLARAVWVGVQDALANSDDACEKLLRRGMRVPGEEGPAAVSLTQLLILHRGQYHESVALLEALLARRPDDEEVRQRLLELAWVRGDEAQAMRLLPPLLDRDLQHRDLPALLFPPRGDAPTPLPVEQRDDEVYARNAYLVRLIEAGRAADAEAAFHETRERFAGARETVHRLDVYLHEGGHATAQRLEGLRGSLARGASLLWSELAGAVAVRPNGAAQRLLVEAAGADPGQANMARLAWALVAARTGQHDEAVRAAAALGPALAALPWELGCEVVARAVLASPDAPESAASAAARALPLPAVRGEQPLSRHQRALAAALAARDQAAAARAAEELFLLEPEPTLYGWVVFAAAERRHDAAATRLWARRLSASSRALAVRVWSLPALARIAITPPR